MNKSAPSARNHPRGSKREPTPLRTIIVAPELFDTQISEVRTRGAQAELASIQEEVDLSKKDPEQTVRAKRLSASPPKMVEVEKPKIPVNFEDVTVRLSRWQLSSAWVARAALLALSVGTSLYVAWPSSESGEAGATSVGALSSETTVAEAAPPRAEVTATSPHPTRTHLAVKEVALDSGRLAPEHARTVVSLVPGNRQAETPKLAISDIAVVWGSTARPFRSLHTAFRKAGDTLCACPSLAEAVATTSAVKATVSMRIRADGSVVWARPSTNMASIRPAMACIEDVLSAIEFPPSQNGLRIEAALSFRQP